MRIHKCDICRKIIKENQKMIVAGLGWGDKEFCTDCGRPIINFLIVNKFIKEEDFNLNNHSKSKHLS